MFDTLNKEFLNSSSLQQPELPLFLRLCFNHQAGAIYFQPFNVQPDIAPPGVIRYDLLNGIIKRYGGKGMPTFDANGAQKPPSL